MHKSQMRPTAHKTKSKPTTHKRISKPKKLTIQKTRRKVTTAIRATTTTYSAPKQDNKKKIASATVKGTKDYFPDSTFLYRHIQKQFESILETYGYNNEIRTPILESAEVFGATLGADSDVVMKQMYQFDDYGVSTVLRPENTASVVRAIVKRGVNTAGENEPGKENQSPTTVEYPDQLFYCGPMFRRERPQNGRLRQFTQFGVENIGSIHPYDDVQVVALAYDCLKSIKMHEHVVLAINTIGTSEERHEYEQALGSYLKLFAHLLSPDSRKRYQNGTFLRILDSSDELDLALVRSGDYLEQNAAIKPLLKTRHQTYIDGTDQDDIIPNATNPLLAPSELPMELPLPPKSGAPLLRHHLSTGSLDRFNVVLKGLHDLNIPYQQDDFLIRGLDYYSHTTFEFLADQNTTDAIAPKFHQFHLHEKTAFETSKRPRFVPITKETPLMTLPQSSYQAILAGGRYGDIATRFDKYKPGSQALQPLNIGMGWASGLERVILHMERLGQVTDDMIAKANKLVDIVVVTMGAKRQLTKQHHNIFLQEYDTHDGFRFEKDEVNYAERVDGELPGEYNGPLRNVDWSFENAKVEAMQHQVYNHHIIDEYKTAMKENKEGSDETAPPNPPPVLPYSPTEVESIITEAALVVATKLRRNGQKVMFQPHLSFQKQMAATHGAKFAVLVGENEVAHNAVLVKNLQSHHQDFVETKDIIEYMIVDSFMAEQEESMDVMHDNGMITPGIDGSGDGQEEGNPQSDQHIVTF